MQDFSAITIVSVTGLGDARGAGYSLEHCLRQMPGARAVLFSPSVPADLSANVRHRVIAPLNYHEYSWFMMFALWRFIETEYVLIVQEDGWILDISNWRDDYLDYDYIGAPITLGRVDTPEGIYWMHSFGWYEHVNRAGAVVMPVLNGGFSLRSRRMLRALIDHPEVRVDIPPPHVEETEPIRMEWFNRALNEDVQLTAALRPQLERLGFRYAPLDVSIRFALEDAGPLHRGVNADASRLFGLHGWWRRLVSVDPLIVRYGISQAQIEASGYEPAIIEMLRRKGFRVEISADAE
jgi:hypothetical protein